MKRSGIKFRETSAGGVVFRGREVLLLQRRTGEWVLPKGHIEEEESKADAALREVREETGLLVDAIDDPVPLHQRIGEDRSAHRDCPVQPKAARLPALSGCPRS